MSASINPVAKKLFIKPEKRWLVCNMPPGFLSLLEPLPYGVDMVFTSEGNFDGILMFVKNNDDLATGLKQIIYLLNADAIFWVAYPKKSSGVKSDLEMMGNWDEATGYGFRVVSAASINEVWTAVRFRHEELSSISETRNAEIRKNEYANFIDVDNKLITLPPDLKGVLVNSPAAMSFYQTLSYSNKKEYVVWILSAKQEKTRNERLDKAVDKLLARKKNPSEK